MQTGDGVGSRSDRALLPSGKPRDMFARQHDPAIDSAHVVVMRGPAFFGPLSGAAQGPGHTMPGYRDAAIKLFLVLRMDLRAVFQSILDAFLRRLGGGDKGGFAEGVSAQEYALALREIVPHGIADAGIGLVGIGDAAIDAVIL